MKGIDVSHHNGTINWDKVKEDGIEFAIIRATHGTESVDEQFERNYAEAKRVGIKVGAYHYLYYVDPIKHQKEVANFIKHIQEKLFEMGTYMDYEEENPRFNPISSLGKQGMTDYALSDFDALRAAGFKPGIYASAYWMINKIDMSRMQEDVIIWCADWSGGIDYTGKVDIHQYCATGFVPGIGSGVDLDITLTDYLQEPVPEVDNNPDAANIITIDGERGPETIKRWQRVMGTEVDGIISTPASALIKADQRFLNKAMGTKLKIDGDEGPKTIKVRQKHLGVEVDGELGPQTNKAHQKALNKAVIGSGAY